MSLHLAYGTDTPPHEALLHRQVIEAQLNSDFPEYELVAGPAIDIAWLTGAHFVRLRRRTAWRRLDEPDTAETVGRGIGIHPIARESTEAALALEVAEFVPTLPDLRSLFGLMQQLGVSVGPLVGGLAIDHLGHDHIVMWCVLAVLPLSAAIAYSSFARRHLTGAAAVASSGRQ